MNAAGLLARLADQGARLSVHDGGLRYHGPARLLTPELRAHVEKHRAPLLGFLSPQTAVSARILIRADARCLPLADGSVNCCVTSPPYWSQRDYGPGERGNRLGWRAIGIDLSAAYLREARERVAAWRGRR